MSYTGSAWHTLNRDSIRAAEIPAYTFVNLHFGIQTERWEAELFARNAFNEETWWELCRGGGWIEQDRLYINAPRQVGVTVRTH